MGEVELTGTPPVDVRVADDWDDSSTDSPPEQAQIPAPAVQMRQPAEKVVIPDGHEEPPAPPLDRTNRTKHRAKSNQMSAEDVPRLQKERAKRGEVERERDAYKAELDSLRQRVEAVERRPLEPAKPEEPIGEFTKAKPKLEDFGNDPDPLGAWNDAVLDWRDEKKAHEAKKAQQADKPVQERQAALGKFYERAKAFQTEHPDYTERVSAVKGNVITPVLAAIIEADDNGPAVVYHLATHPEDLDEFYSATAGKPVADPIVAHTRRQLAQRMSAAPTRSAASRAQTKPTPKPLNLVRTQAESVGAAPASPGDGGSFEEHVAHFHGRRGRR